LVEEWLISPTTPLADRMVTTTPSFASRPGRPGERHRINTLRLACQVEQDVDLMDTSVDEYTTTVEVTAVAPLGRMEGGLFLKSDHPQVADSTTINQLFTLSYCGHKAVVLSHH
jgi:hypothetical protein